MLQGLLGNRQEDRQTSLGASNGEEAALAAIPQRWRAMQALEATFSLSHSFKKNPFIVVRTEP